MAAPLHTHNNDLSDLVAFNSILKFNSPLNAKPMRLLDYSVWKPEKSIFDLFLANLPLPPSY